jgi:RNA polymerase sigma factor (TIGR02999 family)
MRRLQYSGVVADDGSLSDVAALLERLSAGDEAASAPLLDALYAELHRMAHRLMADQRGGHTLQTTALLNEAWMRIAGGNRKEPYQDKRHFVRVAARAMRSVLVDHARKRNAKKRQGGRAQALVTDALSYWDDNPTELLALDEALTRLGERDEELARIVELRFFGGLTASEAGAALGLTERQVLKRWTFARGWLRRELSIGVRDE